MTVGDFRLWHISALARAVCEGSLPPHGGSRPAAGGGNSSAPDRPARAMSLWYNAVCSLIAVPGLIASSARSL